MALLAFVPLVLAQWFTPRAAIDLVMPHIPETWKHFAWCVGYLFARDA
jgi:hypothetical protein